MPVWKKFGSTYHIHINQLTWEYYPISVKSRYRLLVFDLPIKPFLAKSNSNNRKSNKEPLQLVIQAFICITAGQKI